MLETEITIAECLDPSWSDWFEGMTIQTTAAGDMILCGSLPDQSAFYGLITRLASLGLTLVTITVRNLRDDLRKE
jgi:hypothetical protein